MIFFRLAAGMLGAVFLFHHDVSFAATVAVVNGQTLTDQDLNRSLTQMNEGQRRHVLKNPQARRQAIETLVGQEVLTQQARKEKIYESKPFKQAVEAYKKTLAANLLVEKKIGPKINESAAKKFYKRNQRKFSTGQVHVHHVLLTTREEALKIKARAQKGADFQALAEKHSQDPSAKNNRGDVGFIGRGQMVPEFEEIAFNTPKGKIAGPVQTLYGWHVIKVIDKNTGRTLGFAEVEPQVRNALRGKLVKDYVEGLRSKAKVKIN